MTLSEHAGTEIVRLSRHYQANIEKYLPPGVIRTRSVNGLDRSRIVAKSKNSILESMASIKSV